MRIHLDQVQNFIGFAASNAREGEMAKVLTRASIISDEPEFYAYIEQISNIFLSKTDIYEVTPVFQQKFGKVKTRF